MMKNTRAHTNWNKCFIWHFHFWCWCSDVNAGVPSPCPAWTIRSLMLCSRSSILPAISSIREIIYKSEDIFIKTMNSSSISRKKLPDRSLSGICLAFVEAYFECNLSTLEHFLALEVPVIVGLEPLRSVLYSLRLHWVLSRWLCQTCFKCEILVRMSNKMSLVLPFFRFSLYLLLLFYWQIIWHLYAWFRAWEKYFTSSNLVKNRILWLKSSFRVL